MWLLVLPLGFSWNSPNHIIPSPPPSPSPSYLCQENLPVRKSHHDFRANGDISPSPPVPCQGRASSGPRALGAGPEDPPPPLSCHWPGLALAGSHSAQLCIHPGAGEEGRSWEECGNLQILSLISPLPGSSREGQKNAQSPEPTSPGGEGERGADARSLPPQTAFLTLLPSCPALLLSSRPSSLSVGSAILSGCPHFFPSSSC